VHQLLSQAGQYLKKNGLMLVEVGHERPAVEAAYPDLPLTWLSTSAGDDMVFMYSQ
jgi:ribosomal protein L3 glutamine methyltransferase